MVLVLFALMPASIAFDQNYSVDYRVDGTDWLSPNSVHSIYPSGYYHAFTPYIKPLHTMTDYYPVYTYSYYNSYNSYYSYYNYNQYYWNNVWTSYNPVYSYSYYPYYTNYYYSYPYFGYGIVMT